LRYRAALGFGYEELTRALHQLDVYQQEKYNYITQQQRMRLRQRQQNYPTHLRDNSTINKNNNNNVNGLISGNESSLLQISNFDVLQDRNGPDTISLGDGRMDNRNINNTTGSMDKNSIDTLVYDEKIKQAKEHVQDILESRDRQRQRLRNMLEQNATLVYDKYSNYQNQQQQQLQQRRLRERAIQDTIDNTIRTVNYRDSRSNIHPNKNNSNNNDVDSNSNNNDNGGNNNNNDNTHNISGYTSKNIQQFDNYYMNPYDYTTPYEKESLLSTALGPRISYSAAIARQALLPFNI
jgi:hypothetical protein